MQLRSLSDGRIAVITQPAHAWLAGRLVRQWGRPPFAPPAPFDAVCFAAENHDIGWLAWETAPMLDPETGLPRTFTRMPLSAHLSIWRDGINHAGHYGRYPALLVSLHASTIYRRFFNMDQAKPADAETVRAFLDEQRTVQDTLTASLRADDRLADFVTPARIDANRLLIAAADWLSLTLCQNPDRPGSVPNAPTAEGGRAELTMIPAADGTVTIEPWPFIVDRIDDSVEARLLPGPQTDDGALQRILAAAPSVDLPIKLRRQ